jgi:hypothetical protein
MEKWLNTIFESSCSTTKQWTTFFKDIRLHIRKMLTGYKILSFSKGHFYFSFFAQNLETKKIFYVMSDDVRYSINGWYKNLLIRTAKDDEDYTGGSNCFTSLADLKEKADKLTQ